MKMLTAEGQKKAREFILSEARPLEQSLYLYYFEDGAAEDVLTELAEYQNPDGGFGHALEPDLRTPESSALATTQGLQILRALQTPADHPLIQDALEYLLDIYDDEDQRWPIIPPEANDAPHAPWWEYDDDLPNRFGQFLANPRAEIVGYLFDYASLAPRDLPEMLLAAVVSHLGSLPDKISMHDLLCYIRLAETQTLPEEARHRICQKLTRAVDLVVARQPANWEKYNLKPLDVATSPDSPFTAMLAKEISLNLEYEIEHQEEDGCWAPAWSWGGQFPDAWEIAEREWAGVLTLQNLRILDSFGRLV